MNLIATSAPRTMASREIAELTEKNHADVLRDIRNMLEQLGFTASSFAGSYKDSTGRLDAEAEAARLQRIAKRNADAMKVLMRSPVHREYGLAWKARNT